MKTAHKCALILITNENFLSQADENIAEKTLISTQNSRIYAYLPISMLCPIDSTN